MRARAVPFVTEKVGFSVGLEPVEVGNDPDVKAVVAGLLDAQKLPTEKYEEPITSAQEVGWYSKPLVPQNARFVYGLKQVRVSSARGPCSACSQRAWHGTAGSNVARRNSDHACLCFSRVCHQAEATEFAETYTKKMAGEHMFHGKSGKYLKF